MADADVQLTCDECGDVISDEDTLVTSRQSARGDVEHYHAECWSP